MKKVYIRRTRKEEGLYPENKKGKRFISGEQWRKKVYIRRKRKEKGLCPENNEGRKSISEEKKHWEQLQSPGSTPKLWEQFPNPESIHPSLGEQERKKIMGEFLRR